MAVTASGGQTLTPAQNVTAVAGMGGDVWGANGGDAVPIGGGATDQTGFTKPIASTLCNGETQTNFIGPANVAFTKTLLGRENNASLSAQTADGTQASGAGWNTAG